MTFSPELEAKFAKLLESYPPGRTRSAVIPMLLFAQDELGHISNELIEEVARRCKVTPLAGGRGGRLLFDAASQTDGQVSRAGLHQHQLPVARRRRAIRACVEDSGHLGHKEVAPDGQFSLEEVECIGACCWAPAIQINYDFHHFVTEEKLDGLIAELRKNH